MKWTNLAAYVEKTTDDFFIQNLYLFSLRETFFTIYFTLMDKFCLKDEEQVIVRLTVNA